MATILSCTRDPLTRKFPCLSSLESTSRGRFGHQEALLLLQNCTNFNQLKLIHARIIRHHLSHDQLLVRKMLRLCSSYGKMDYATILFHQIQVSTTFTWNLMVRILTINGSSKQALLLYSLMISRGFAPDKFTFPFAIKACTVSYAIDKGREIHGLAIKSGFSQDMFVQNTLMDLYFKCGHVNCGRKVFSKMRVRSPVSWTTMIGGLIASGELDAAREAFEQMPVKNVVSWTTMMNGYVRNQQPQKVFKLFRRMQLDNVNPNNFTLVCLVKACAELGSLKLGRWVHDFALRNGFEVGVFLGTALIDMYSNCGSIEEARQVFNIMETKTVATWNSMITSLGVHGYGEEAIELFRKMEKANLHPDAITFIGVLCACINTNNVSEGYRYFKYMSENYGIQPNLGHYTCMIELYNRAKISDEISKTVDNMPVKQNDDTRAALRPRFTDTDAIGNIEILYDQQARKLHNLGACTCCLSQYHPRRFKWDVG